jgi:hypothetical protein
LDELDVHDAVQLKVIGYNARSQVPSLDTGGTASHARRESYTYDDRTGLLTGQMVKDIAESSTFLSLSFGYARGAARERCIYRPAS